MSKYCKQANLMIPIFLTVCIIMFATFNSKFFGISTHNAHNIRIGVLIAVIIWLLYTHIQTIRTEGFSPAPAPATMDYSTSMVDTLPKKMIDFDTDPIMNPSPLYEPGTVKYGGTGYTPSHEQLAYNNDYKFKTLPDDLTKLSSYESKGFCELPSSEIDEKCNALPKGTCATTSCCVLVGGDKCVQGNEQGPKESLIYSDTTIKNRDVYYYQGKCYGNC
jgi:hypothetical protein